MFYKKRRTTKRRSTRRTRRYTRNVPRRIPEVAGGSKIVKLKYVDILTGSVSTSPVTYQYRLNSLFDSDYTGGGHQPRGYDQWCGLYQWYTVYGCKVKLQVVSTNVFLVSALGQVEDSAISSDPTNTAELPYAKTVLMTANDGNKKLKCYYNIPKMYGATKKAILTDDEYGAPSSANPANVAYLNIVGQHPDFTTTVGYYILVTLTYYAKLEARKRLPQS